MIILNYKLLCEVNICKHSVTANCLCDYYNVEYKLGSFIRTWFCSAGPFKYQVMMAQRLGYRIRNHTVLSSSPVTAVSSLGIGSINYNEIPNMTRWLCTCMQLVM